MQPETAFTECIGTAHPKVGPGEPDLSDWVIGPNNVTRFSNNPSTSVSPVTMLHFACSGGHVTVRVAGPVQVSKSRGPRQKPSSRATSRAQSPQR